MNYLYIFLIASFSLSSDLKGKGDDSETEKLYRQSLIYHISRTIDDTVFVFKDFDIELPTKSNNVFVFDILNFSEFVKGRPPFKATKIFPIEVNKACVDVLLVDFHIEMKDGEIQLTNLGGETFTYCYNAKQKKHQLVKRKRNP